MGAPQYEQAGADIGGTGTTNTIPRWTGPSTLGDSIITQSGTNRIGVTGAIWCDAAGGVGGVAFGMTDSASIRQTGTNAIMYFDASTTGGNGQFVWRSGNSLTERWRINSSGHLLAGADNSYDIGAPGATRPKTVYVGTSAVIADGTIAAATGATQPYVTISATGSATNIGMTLQPKGSGAISAQLPDGAATGGNARGSRAVDFQLVRAAASMVASGSSSLCAGENCTASGNYSVALGYYCTAQNTAAVALGYNNNPTGFAAVALGDSSSASGSRAVAIGQSCAASASNAFAAGNNCTASAIYAVAMGSGNAASGQSAVALGQANTASGQFAMATGSNAAAVRYGQLSHTGSGFAALGDAQKSLFVAIRGTADATPTKLTLSGGALSSTTALSLPNNTAWAADVHLVARSATGAGHAYFVRRVLIKRDANAASTALVGTVQTIGTDIGSNAGAPPAGWAITITADTTNGALDLEVTGAAGTTIRWVARVELVEVGLA